MAGNVKAIVSTGQPIGQSNDTQIYTETDFSVQFYELPYSRTNTNALELATVVLKRNMHFTVIGYLILSTNYSTCRIPITRLLNLILIKLTAL